MNLLDEDCVPGREVRFESFAHDNEARVFYVQLLIDKTNNTNEKRECNWRHLLF